MLNGKEIKSIKNMVITVTPERTVYSGGSVIFNNNYGKPFPSGRS